MGPTDLPETIFNYGDYTRAFGGLSFDYPLSYAVQDFFANGGSQAIICRLFEPSDGSDGFAQLRFAGGPPALPVDWVIDAKVAAGAKQMPVSGPSDSEGEPNIGETFYVDGDKSQQYLVTAFSPADPTKKKPATISFLPGLAKAYQQCTQLDFSEGPDASGWSVLTQSSAKITLQGGKGIPELDDVLTFGGYPGGYAVNAEPVVTGDDIASMRVIVTVTPAPPATIYPETAVSVGPPQPLPMPVGWEIGQAPSSSSVTSHQRQRRAVGRRSVYLWHEA